MISPMRSAHGHMLSWQHKQQILSSTYWERGASQEPLCMAKSPALLQQCDPFLMAVDCLKSNLLTNITWGYKFAAFFDSENNLVTVFTGNVKKLKGDYISGL